ncbi:MAG TPA: DUF488 family protein [Chitinophagaceae bacterium]|nr:DUF488 family protein [Chitinophagaceae bacterium]
MSIKRIYERKAAADGYRVLVDRLWPRGMKKEDAGIDRWLKEVAPSTELRKWFNHDADKWAEFQKRYLAELKDNDAWDELRELAKEHKALTLLYSTKEEKNNHAAVLAKMLHDKK